MEEEPCFGKTVLMTEMVFPKDWTDEQIQEEIEYVKKLKELNEMIKREKEE